MNAPDYIFYNGNIIVDIEKNIEAEALSIEKNIVGAFGKEKEIMLLADRDTKYIDLNRKTLLPGFIDSHCHPWLLGSSLIEIDCSSQNIKSKKDLLMKIKGKAEQQQNGTWIRAQGYDEVSFEDGKPPTRWELDEVSPNNPVYLRRRCWHAAVVNSQGLFISGINKDTVNPEGGEINKDKNGQPTGLLKGKAQNLIKMPAYSAKEMKEGILLALKKFASLGITTLHDAGVNKEIFQVYQELLTEGQLPLRVRLWFFGMDMIGFKGMHEEIIKTGIRSGFGNDRLKVMGLKFMADGGIAAKTAAVFTPYESESDNKGKIFIDTEELSNLIYDSVTNGLRTAIHVVGDRGVDITLKAYELAEKKGAPIKETRNRLEHCALLRNDHYDKIKKLNLIPSVSSVFIYFVGDTYKNNIGKKRMNHVFPYKSLINNGIISAANSDCPICEPNPLIGISTLVNRATASGDIMGKLENISVSEALRAYTCNGSYTAFEEEYYGSLLPGKYADLVVLSDNPYEVNTQDIKDIKINLTIINGEISHSTII